MKRIRISIGGAEAEAQLFEDAAPKTVETLWKALPLQERTIQVRWSGDAWRTEGDYELLPSGLPVENIADRLDAGDIIYFPATSVCKIGFAYGKAKWLNPFMEPLDVAHIGKIDTNLCAFVERCQRIIFDGPIDVEITRVD